MNFTHGDRRSIRLAVVRGAAALSFAAAALSLPASAQGHSDDAPGQVRKDLVFYPGNLVVSRSVYDNLSTNVAIGQKLPPNCPSTAKCPKGTTQYDGTYPVVFNNVLYDASFGITSRIFLDQITLGGQPVSTLEVPNSLDPGIGSSSNQLVTSFSSKSEMSLHLSTAGDKLTFMGYVAPVNSIDVSNANTPLGPDPSNPVGIVGYRGAATVDAFGNFTYTLTNAYSGNNPRGSVLNDTDGANVIYVAGNAGNGKGDQPASIILGAGAQLITPSTQPESAQTPGQPTPLASFNVSLLGDPADKLGKDDNFHGITIFDNVVYFTKSSGSNGINTVYFVDTTGTACPGGVGLPAKNATLPTAPLSYNPATVTTTGLPSNMCVLAGFPTVLASDPSATFFPTSLWFADANTVYIADQGDGYTDGADLYTHAAAQTTAGLQKWTFDQASGSWKYAYTLTSGLGLGEAYTVDGYPTGTNAATGLPWAPATDGLRSITGRRNGDGTAVIWAITSTVSGNGDTGADPNRLVVIRDDLKNTGAGKAATESFVTLKSAGFAEVLRGVSLTPGSDIAHGNGPDKK